MNLNSNVRNTENSELHRYCQKEMLSLLHQFPFEYITLKHEQVADYNSESQATLWILFVNPGPGIVAILVIVIIVSGFFFEITYKYKIQYVAET